MDKVIRQRSSHMSNLTKRSWRWITLGILSLSIVLMTQLTAFTAEPNTTPTFTKDIAPIFQVKCESCHRPDSIAPMSLITYEDAYPRRGLIRDRVVTRQMPPWHLDKTVGIKEYKYDRSLSDVQLDTIVRWIDAGAPKGDPKDMPSPMKWPTEQG